MTTANRCPSCKRALDVETLADEARATQVVLTGWRAGVAMAIALWCLFGGVHLLIVALK
jgi:hypothetical protein